MSDDSQASVAEVQALNYILQSKGEDFFRVNRLTTDHFPGYHAEAEFVTQHISQYGTVPDAATLLEKFPKFIITEVAEAPQSIVTRLKEQRLYSVLAPVMRSAAEKVQDDSFDAYRFLQEEIAKLSGEAVSVSHGSDLVRGAQDRLEQYRERSQAGSKLAIPSGIPSLDNVIYGWFPGELITIIGYLGNGKSMLALYMAIAAWKAGFKVGLISLEMDEYEVGFRFDALVYGERTYNPRCGIPDFGDIRNSLLNAGNLNVEGTAGYEKYIEWLRQCNPFPIYTAKDFPDGQAGVEDAESIITEHDLDLLVIDQLSLMRLVAAKDIRQGYIKTTTALKSIVMRLMKRIILLAQASREAEKQGKKDGSAPDIDQVMESNSVAENSNKAVSIKLDAATGLAKIKLPKNRMGKTGLEVMMRWDVDQGKIHEVSSGGNPTGAGDPKKW